MLRSIVVLIACSTSYLVLAHTHCHYDERAVDPDGLLSFCPMDYALYGTCCDAEEEALLEATFNEAGDLTDECADYYQQVGISQFHKFILVLEELERVRHGDH